MFQLLLQLSDTMLDINTQLNTTQSATYSQSMNSNQLFCLNSFLGPETSNFLYEEEEEEDDLEDEDPLVASVNESLDTDKLSIDTTNVRDTKKHIDSSTTSHKANVIEEFLSKTLHTSQSMRAHPHTATASASATAAGSVSNIINCFNRSGARNGSYFSTPSSQSFRSPLAAKPHKHSKPIIQLKQLQFNKHTKTASESSSSSSSPSSVANLIENIYDKTSVTQFVDSLLNHNGAHTATANKTQSITSIDETSNISDCGFSTMSSTNNEPVYQSIDADFLKKSTKKHQISTATTNQILARHFVSTTTAVNKTANLKKANSSRETTFTCMKTSKSNSSTSSNSSGAVSMSSSSNNDLTSYSTPDTHTNRNSTSSTVSSVLTSPMSCLSTSSSNHETLTLTQGTSKQYENVPETTSNPTYKRSNSVNYKSVSQQPTAHHHHSMTNRKPSFKFESTILNKVQFMNMSKTEPKMQPLNETKVLLANHESDLGKRSSLGRDADTYEHKSTIRRQQSTNSSKSYTQHQQQQQAQLQHQASKKMNTSAKLPSAQSIMINQIKMNQHQMSLDSGIFLPSENEEYNSFNINLVR